MIIALSRQRIASIDAFRGLTILVMVFVNQLAGVSGVPQWARHMKADADAMSFVDAATIVHSQDVDDASDHSPMMITYSVK